MLIKNQYQFSFPTVSTIEKSLKLKPGELSRFPSGGKSININYPTLGSNGAYFLIPVSAKLNGITGIDNPVLISNPIISARGTVVILAQDPLRSEKDYPKVKWDRNYVVSLPFAVHCDLNTMRCIYNTIDLFLMNGYSVYITDCRKIYCKGQKQCVDIQCLKDELVELASLGDIEAIVTFGNQAKEIAGKLNSSATRETLIHPSGSANAKWKGLLGGLECTLDNKWKYIERQLCKDLVLVQ